MTENKVRILVNCLNFWERFQNILENVFSQENLGEAAILAKLETEETTALE